MEPVEAMLDAIKAEMRAVTMITLSAVFGMIPMAIDTGLGCELRRGIGQSAIGGIVISAVMTMFILPVLYCLFTKKTNKN